MTTLDIVFWVGAFDAVMIAGLGVVGAVITIFDLDNKVFWDRVVPACLILVATSFASGVVMIVTRWLTGT